MSSDAHPTPLIQVDQISKGFFRTKILQDISFTVSEGVICGLIGPNGCGKSTLLKCLFGFQSPDKGQILVGGIKPGRRTRLFTSYCPETEGLYPFLKVGETIRFFAAFYRDWSFQRERALIDLLELDPGSQVRRLSKGQRGRLKLLLALARQARLVLLDEPLAGADPVTRTAVLKAIVSEFRADEQSIILSTHQVQEAETLFDQVLFMEKGAIVLSGQYNTLRAESQKKIHELLVEAAWR